MLSLFYLRQYWGTNSYEYKLPANFLKLIFINTIVNTANITSVHRRFDRDITYSTTRTSVQ